MSIILQCDFGRRTINVLNSIEYNNIETIKEEISNREGIPVHFFTLWQNGKQLTSSESIVIDQVIHASCGLVGGKGGFGSMLRAIGAQIEKTTNREACRDLSGRRLRDINEEQRLKKWLVKKDELKIETDKKRKEKLERLCSEPVPVPLDEEFHKQMEENAEKVSKAVEEGLAIERKRKAEEAEKSGPAKKRKHWMGFDPSDSDESTSDEDEQNALIEVSSKSSTSFEHTKIEADFICDASCSNQI